MSAFTLPDTFVVAPLSTSEFDPATGPLAAEVIAAGPESVYHRLVSDQESEVVFLLARHVLNGFLGASGSPTAQETREPGPMASQNGQPRWAGRSPRCCNRCAKPNPGYATPCWLSARHWPSSGAAGSTRSHSPPPNPRLW